MRALIASLLLVTFAFTNTACIGRMATSGKVMKFNLEAAEGKWGRELVFLLLYIIPVYPIAGFLDLVIFNSIEFHSGTNPISGESRLARAGDQKTLVAEDGTRAVSTLQADGSVDIEIETPDGSRHFVNVIRENGHPVARDADGNVIAFVGDDGRVQIAAAASFED